MSTSLLDTPLDAPAAVAPASSTGFRRLLPLALGTLAVLGLGTWGFSRWRFSRHHVTSDNAQVEGHIVPVAPKVQAFVAQVRVEENQAVHAGDTLVVLDDRDLKVRLAQAEADLATALAAAGRRGESGQAQAQFAWSEATAQSAEASVASAEAAQRKAAADLERIRGLAARQIVAGQQLDAAQAAFDVANANLLAARRQSTAADNQVRAYGAAVSAAEARVAAARAALDNARLQLSYAVITSPDEGTIGRRAVEPGALVQVGQTLLSVLPSHALWVTANLKETELASVAVGDSVAFEVDAYPGHEFRGHVESLSPATGARFALLPPDNATGNYTKVVQRVPVRIAVDSGTEDAHPLRPGMSVVVTIATR